MRILAQTLRIIVCLMIVFIIGSCVVMFTTGIQPKAVSEESGAVEKGSLALIDTTKGVTENFEGKIYALEINDKIYLRPVTLKTDEGYVIEDIEGENILADKSDFMGTVTDSYGGTGNFLRKVCRLPVAIVFIIFSIIAIILPDVIPLKEKKFKPVHSESARMDDFLKEEEESAEKKDNHEEKGSIYIIEKLGKKKLKISQQKEEKTGESE